MASQSGGYRTAGGGGGDGERRRRPNFSSMEQPPLLKQLKCILAEYPDGGQIVKELIQNAEDAGANTVKIMYDARPVNQESTHQYSKFFKGPALLLYNDGMFTEQDWKGIKMIYSSVKEADRLKVGRFGLGFKSVFHITDFPSIISGNRLLLINPHEHANEVNAEFEVDHLAEYEGIDVSEFHNAFGDTFQEITTTGPLQGTIFRFPLRQLETPLSDNIYDENKVLDLFTAFKKEASHILLFLKCISNITLSVKKGNGVFESVAAVELVNNLQEVQAERTKFKSKISGIGPDYNGSAIESFSEIHIQTTLYAKNIVSQQSTQTWLVVSYFIGNTASNEFKMLIRDKSIGYSPYVGIAAPLCLNAEERCDGHEFCFLPLPKEGNVTGLPFHINGFFSLSQNRHHIKWATDEQQGSRITDKNILWNLSLAGEALPLAYSVLLENTIHIVKSRHLGVETIAGILPMVQYTAANWTTFVNNLFHNIKDMSFLKVHRQDTWVTVDKACFATFSCLGVGGPETDKDMKKHVIESLLLMHQPYVEVSTDLFKTFCHFYGEINDTCPQTLSQLLKKSGQLTSLESGVKCSLFQFLLSSNNQELLLDLEIIPLASKEWGTFRLACSYEEKLLLPSEAFRQMTFPGLENCFVEVPDTFLPYFHGICSTGRFNVKHQTLDDTIKMLSKLLSKYGESITNGSFLSLPWLEKVWSYFRFHVSSICSLSLVPLLRSGTWENVITIKLIPLNQMIILKTSDGHKDLSDGLCSCLENLSITVLPSLPPWFPLDATNHYIFFPSQLEQLLRKMADISNIDSLADSFNKQCPAIHRDDLRTFFACSYTDDRKLIELQKKLKIFYESNNLNAPQLVSMESTSHRLEYVSNLEYPIRYPKQYLLIDETIEHFVKRLGASRRYLGDLVELTLQQSMDDYSEQDTGTFMRFFIDKFEELSTRSNIKQVACKVKFVKSRGSTNMKSPSELFDPTDELLQNLLDDELFPEITQPSFISILKRLGLNDDAGLTADHMRNVAVFLDKISSRSSACDAKADAFMSAICKRPQLLKDKCATGRDLKSELSALHWIKYVQNAPPSFPICIPWFLCPDQAFCKPDEAKLFETWHTIIGAVMPTVQCVDQEVINHFGWNIDPHVSMVAKQLELVSKNYRIEFNAEILMLVKAIYEFLDNHKYNSMEAFNLQELVWCGHKFVSPRKIVVNKTPESIDIQPYFYFIPEEMLKFAELFKALGCHQTQDTDLLLSVLTDVKKKYQHGNDLNAEEDLHLVVRVLERLGKIEDIANRASEILIPVQTSEQDQLVLKPASECAYTDEEYMRDEEDEGEFTFVHECISGNMAKAFGIKTIAGHVLADAEGLGVEEWGQEEPLTTRLNSLLREGYKDGLSVPKELVQNADDANASVMKILYDERQNSDSMSRLLNKGMQECQGPALWFYNDASFTEADFQNIIKLNGATKKNDGGKIGKFGLGFCSVYNLTDVPCFFSGTTFVVFDPHKAYLRDTLPGAGCGMKINLNTNKRKTQIRKYKDQFTPFQDVFGCSVLNLEPETPFDGTLFRFPLRTDAQAKSSKIKQTVYSKDEVSLLLSMFIETAGDMLLFTQNLKKIEIYHLGPNSKPRDSKLLFSITKEIQSVKLPCNTCRCSEGISVLQTMSSVNTSLSDVHVVNIAIDIYDAAESLLPGSKEMHTQSSWVVSWASGKKEAKELASLIADRRALPLAAVASPCHGNDKLQPYPLGSIPSGFHKSGRLFCFLPLPLKSELCIQLNACFDVTSDRRQLLSDSEDDKETLSHQWNKALLTDACVNAFIQLLESIISSSLLTEYYSIWPTCTSKQKHTKAFVSAFYTYIVAQNSQVFKGIESTILPFSEVTFIDPLLMENKSIGKYCLKLLSKFQPQAGKEVIDIPINIVEILEICQQTNACKHVVDKAKVKEEELIVIFLNSLQDPFWQDEIEMRNAMLSFSLKSVSEKIVEMLKTKDCIPTKPNGRLRKPGDIVSEKSNVATLFTEDDERFIESYHMFDFNIERKLERLGMITDKLPEDLLLERCKFIEKKSKSCCECGYKLCLNILHYFCRSDVQQDMQSKEDIVKEISQTNILPVLCRPHNWSLPWFSDQCEDDILMFSAVCKDGKHKEKREQLRLGKPNMMFRQELANSLCCAALLVNERDYKIPLYEKDSLKFLGVKDYIPFTKAVRQFEIIISNYTKGDVESFRPVISELYHFFSEQLNQANTSEQTKLKECLKMLSDSPVVMIDNYLVKASSVAFKVENECKPYLYRLPESYISKRSLFEAFGVKDYFPCADVIAELKRQKEKWLDSTCIDMDKICSLLKVLVESMEVMSYKYENLQESHSFIVAPDANKILRPTSELVTDEDNFVTKQKVYVLNGEIPPALAQQLGVLSKQKKCRENISRGIPFGQKEELVTRLQGLLKAYPLDSGIMKELIQNADDAGATEICFIKDFKQHAKDEKYGCEFINEPSLCVYNNSSFTEQDMLGIHNLGRGSKGSDPTKTGQYGVGFNAVYHLTDLPSFMTIGPGLPEGGSVCIFDPLCNHIVDVSKDEPGIRSEVNGLKSDFPNVLLGFHEELCNGVGTVFRFPLRQKESCLSSNVLKQEDLVAILEQLKKDMLDVLLFVKNVSCIKIMDISSGHLVEEYAVDLQMSEKDRENFNTFNNSIKQHIKQQKEENSNTISIPIQEVHYNVTINDSINIPQKWLIVQRCGFHKCFEVDANIDLISAFKSGDIGLIPVGGVALPLNGFDNYGNNVDKAQNKVHTTKKISPAHLKGRVFCFLPLPLSTDLPVHINGHFSLDHEARRELWKGGYRETWNDCLLIYLVIPAWISGIERLQKMYVNRYIQQCDAWSKVNEVMELYHSSFPLKPFPTKQSSPTYWDKCVRFFYESVTQNSSNIFPVVIEENHSFHTSWFPVKSPEAKIPHSSGVFNVIARHTRTLGWSTEAFKKEKRPLRYLLSNIFKKLGMRLLHTPITICEIMRSLDLQTDISDTSYVISFLQTFSKDDCICKIGPMDTPIEQTNFENVDNLVHVARYICSDENFSSQINGLPILLTGDGILHKCSVDKTVLLSDFLDLLPQSKALFLHKHLVTVFSSCLKEKQPVVVELTIETFVSLLPDSFDINVFCSGKNVPLHWPEESPVSVSWSCWLFQFLFSKGKSDFDKSLKSIGKWSFLPSVQQCTGQSRRFLIPIENVYSLFKQKILGDTDRKLNELLASLNLPDIDGEFSKLIKTQICGFDILSLLRQLCASTERPDVLLRCLVTNKNILLQNINPDLARELVMYFSNNLNVLKEKYGPNLMEDMNCLPLFITSQGTVVTIHEEHRVCVIPERIPSDGVAELAQRQRIILLQEDHYFKTLYEFLGLSFQSQELFYADTLLPSLETSMHTEYWMKHINYIKSNCLFNNGEFTQEQKRILEHLQHIPFVNSKKANEYFHHDHPVFKCMLPPSNLLPEAYRTRDWIKFLEKIGLVMEVDDTKFVDFARQIETRGTILNDEVQHKSMVLVNELLSRKQTDLLQRIGDICFIVPFKVEASVEQYCSQYQKGAELICFRNSATERNWKRCWTCLPIIPESISSKLNKEQQMQLGILIDIPLSDVVTHCSQVCFTLKELLKNDRGNGQLANFVSMIMDVFYIYLDRNLKKDSVQAVLKHIPLVYIPILRDLVRPDQTVVELPEEYQILPYIYRIPSDYSRYGQLFIALGGQQYLTCTKLALILKKVYLNYREKNVIGTDHGVVTKTLQLFFHILISAPNNDAFTKQLQDIPELYLPNREMVMYESTSVVIDNNRYLSKRLQKIQLNWFIGLEELEIGCLDESDYMKKFPQKIKPLFLSDMVKQNICLENLEIIEQSELSVQLREFLQSKELLEGLVRLMRNHKKKVEQTALEKVRRNLMQIECIHVKQLQTVLQLNSCKIEGSEADKECHIQKENLITKFYFQVKDPSKSQCLLPLNKAKNGVLKLILDVLQQPVEEIEVLLILDCLYKPNEIRQILDDHEIDSYKMFTSVNFQNFPAPGTYVEDRMLPFLVQDLRPFQFHEYRYVAMEFTHLCNEGEEKTFKYVHINHRIPSHGSDHEYNMRQEYSVDCGEENSIIVGIAYLYKFMRPSSDGKDTFGYEPQNEEEFQNSCHEARKKILEAWKLTTLERDRVFERLMEHWCDGKNKGNEFAKRVFNYICEIIIQLERSEQVSECVNNDTGRIAPDTQHSSIHKLNCSVQENSRNRVRSLCSDRSFYNNYDHSSAAEAVRPDIGEARRWLRQATYDYHAARVTVDSIGDVPAHNWTCYKCHQACEKAMKAVRYSINANNVPNNVASHNLNTLAENLSTDMQDQARLIMCRLGDQSQLRYPDAVYRERIPSDMFDMEAAKFAIEHTKQVLELAGEAIDST